MHTPAYSKVDIVRNSVRTLLAKWLADGAPSAQYINSGGGPECGCCVDFADELYWTLKKQGIEVDEFGVDSFLMRNSDADYGDGNPFDRPLLAKYWPKVVPPSGFSWEDLAQVSKDAGFSACTHQWIHLEGIHFDAECPDGVENFFELPFLKRGLASWRQSHPCATAVQ